MNCPHCNQPCSESLGAHVRCSWAARRRRNKVKAEAHAKARANVPMPACDVCALPVPIPRQGPIPKRHRGACQVEANKRHMRHRREKDAAKVAADRMRYLAKKAAMKPRTLPCPDCKTEVLVTAPRPHGHLRPKRCDPCHLKADAQAQADRRSGRLRVLEAVPLDGVAWEKFEAACAVRRAELREQGVFGRAR